MYSKMQRIVYVGFYAYVAWKFLLASAMTVLWAVWLTLQFDPAGAFMIPVAGFFAMIGWRSLSSLRQVYASPYY